MPSKPSSKPSIKFERGSGRRSKQVEDLKKTVDAITVRCFKAEKHRLELLSATTKVLNLLTRETYPSVAIYDLKELVKKINMEMTKP